MKAIVAVKYGLPDYLQLRDLQKPVPKNNEVLIRIHAATVTRGDVFLQNLPLVALLTLRLIMGLKRKRIPGHEFSGEIESTGKDVRLFKTGDRVFGTTTGLNAGSYAEYVCLPAEGTIVKKPVAMTFEEAAAVPVGGLTALYFLRKGSIGNKQKVLIYGASGSVGTFAVQIARYFDAEVTAVSGTANLELVKSLGAHKVIDYTKESFSENGETYDIVFDAVGKISESDARKALTFNGKYVTVKKGIVEEKSEDLVFLRDLIDAGKIKSVIDKRFSLDQAAEAHKYVGRKHKRGNVVLTIDQNI